MKKPFPEWNTEKQSLEYSTRNIPRVHEREIWWCSVGINIGDEQDGKHEKFERPILILKKFNASIVWAIPMTSKYKAGDYYQSISYGGETSTLILSQMRLISTKRLRRFIGKVSTGQFTMIRSKIKALL